MGIQQLKRRVWSGVLTFLLAGVVQHAAMADVQAPVDALLEQQLATIERTLEQATSGARSVLYLGAAQNAQSPAFHEDVLRVQQRLQAVNPKLQSIVLSNDTHHKQGPYPAATLNTLRQALTRMAEWSRKYPLTVVVLVAPHGKVATLSSKAASDLYAPLQSRHLRVWLDALGQAPTVLMISSCRAASFVPKLAAEHRIVLAAAAADRNPSACDEPGDNTHFIDDLFGVGFDPAKTWQQNFDRTGAGATANTKSSIPDTLAQQTIADFLRP